MYLHETMLILTLKVGRRGGLPHQTTNSGSTGGVYLAHCEQHIATVLADISQGYSQMISATGQHSFLSGSVILQTFVPSWLPVENN